MPIGAVALPWLALVALILTFGVAWGLSQSLGVTAWRLVSRIVDPLWALIRAMLPLLLPVAVIALYATVVLSHLAQIVAGVTLAALIWLFLRGEAELRNERWRGWRLLVERPRSQGQDSMRAWDRDALIAAIRVGFWLLLGLALFFALTRFNYFDWKAKAGWTGAIEWIAVATLVAAFWLRLYGYATTPARWLNTVLVLCLGGRVLMAVGVFPGSDWFDEHHLPAGPSCAVLAALLLLFVSAEAIIELARQPMWQRRFLPKSRPGPVPTLPKLLARRLGLAFSGFAALTFAVALFAALISVTDGPKKLGRVTTATEVRNVDVTGDGKFDELDLAWTFAPVLHLHPMEQFPPVAVSMFLRTQTIEQGARKVVDKHGNVLPLNFQTLPVDCPDGGQQACGRIICGPLCRAPAEAGSGWRPQGVLYARVLYRERPRDKQAFSGWIPRFGEGQRLSMMVQYWIFYAYDKWDTETMLGELIQQHEGDWEHVTVGLAGSHAPNAKSKPLFVALSAHCGGRVVQWTKDLPAAYGGRPASSSSMAPVVIAPTPVVPNTQPTHPIVAVAKGSHANYAIAEDRRPPDWGSCRDLPSDALAAAAYASNIRDLTDPDNQGWFAYPRKIRVVTRLTRPMSYPGYWGAGETISFGQAPAPSPSGGPKSPPMQGNVWNAPLRLYFCGGHWVGYGKGDDSECHPNRNQDS